MGTVRQFARGTSAKVLFIVGLVILAAVVVVVGASVGLRSIGFTAAQPNESAPSCPYKRGCATMTVAEVTAVTGYRFPEGSRVRWAYDETSWFDNSRSIRARVAMPAGSAIPETDATLTTLTVIRNDSTAVEVEVHRLEGGGN